MCVWVYTHTYDLLLVKQYIPAVEAQNSVSHECHHEQKAPNGTYTHRDTYAMIMIITFNLFFFEYVRILMAFQQPSVQTYSLPWEIFRFFNKSDETEEGGKWWRTFEDRSEINWIELLHQFVADNSLNRYSYLCFSPFCSNERDTLFAWIAFTLRIEWKCMENLIKFNGISKVICLWFNQNPMLSHFLHFSVLSFTSYCIFFLLVAFVVAISTDSLSRCFCRNTTRNRFR